MSLSAMVRVWGSALPRDQKYICLALANWADEDGGSIFPAMERVAYMTEYSLSQVKAIMADLRKEKKLIRQGLTDWGTVEYKLNWPNIPAKPAYRPKRRGRPAKMADKNESENQPQLQKNESENQLNGAENQLNESENQTESLINQPINQELKDSSKEPLTVWAMMGQGKEVKNPRAQAALAKFQERQASGNAGPDFADWPPSTVDTLKIFLKYWPLDLPAKPSRGGGEFAEWCKECEALALAVGEWGERPIKMVFDEWTKHLNLNKGKPPFTVARPGAIVKSVKSKVAILRITQPAPQEVNTAAVIDDKESKRAQAQKMFENLQNK